MRLAAALALALIVAAPAGAAPARAQEDRPDDSPEYSVSTVLPAPFPWGLAAERWAELVAARTDGRITLRIHPGAELVSGDQTREFAAMRDGRIDMAVGSTINWSPQVRELNLFALPFLMPDYAAIDALTHGPVGERLFAIVERQGVVPLAWAENGFREVSNSVRPIRTPADLHGLRMRVVGSPLFNDVFTALGANPTLMSWADARPALATGAVDGQENPLSVFHTAGLHELGQDHLTLWHYAADPLIFAVNRQVWESFTPEDREILRRAAVEAGAYGVAEARRGLSPEDDRLVQEIEDRGVAVVRLTDAERRAFVDATRQVYADWAERIGPDLVRLAEESIAARHATE